MLNDSHQHVIKTTSQWNERIVEFWVVPRGCLCVELTEDGKTKLKVGEGNKFYSQLPYVYDESILSQYYTKEEIDNIMNNINRMAIMSTDEYDSKNDLPLEGNKLGDVRLVKSASPSIKTDPDLYVWNNTKWIYVGYDLSNIDLSKYLTKEEFHQLFDPVNDKVDEMYPMRHTHNNKDVLDKIDAPYTIPEKEKLARLHNYDDTELRELIHETAHTHQNKNILDTITSDSLWSVADREKFDSLHNYDDTAVVVRIETLEGKAHTHDNKDILDRTTSPFTVEDKTKLDSLHNDEPFIGTDGMYPGYEGNVPAPKTTDIGKFLASDGTWKYAGFDTDFVGATPTTDGAHGLVPMPLAGEQAKFLRGDGRWAKVKSGDKYRAGDGITILSGEVISDTFPFQLLPQAEQVTQYIIYGAPGGVGEYVDGGYRIQINASAEGHTDRSATVIIPDKLYEGDYVDYQKQVYSTYRTNVTSRVSADPNYNRKWGIYSDGRIARKDPGAYGNAPGVTALFELEPGASYEITAYYDNDSWKFEDAMHINLYDADQNVTRTIAQSCTGNTTFTPAPTDKYMRFAYREDIWSWTAHGRQSVYQLKDIERPCGLPELFLYPGIINTINATTTVKPSLMYIEIEPPDDPESEDPMSEFTGIIYNDGVIDVTQEDPNALNELTVHFRESEKVLIIPTNDGTEQYGAGAGINIIMGEASGDKFPIAIASNDNYVEEYIIYGTAKGVGDYDPNTHKFVIPIVVTTKDEDDPLTASIYLDDPLGQGEYITYSTQNAMKYREDVMNRNSLNAGYFFADGGHVFSGDVDENNVPISYATEKCGMVYGDRYIISGLTYDEHDPTSHAFEHYMSLNDLKGGTMPYSTSPSAVDSTRWGASNNQWINITILGYIDNVYKAHFYHMFDQLKEFSATLPRVLLYAGKINTINIATENKPDQVYFRAHVNTDPDAPKIPETWIIENTGVIDVEQDQTNLNQLTFIFKDSEKVITIPGGGGGGGTYIAGDGIDIDANDEISVKISEGLQFDANGAIEANLGAGLQIDTNNAIEVVPATTTTIGGVIVGDGLDVDASGVVDVKPGDGLTIDGNGAVSMVPATTTTIGGVSVGSGLKINNDGELSLKDPSVTDITNTSGVPGSITVSKSDGTSSDVDVLSGIRLILNCNFDSSIKSNALGVPVHAPATGNTINSPILGDLSVLEVE